MRKFSLAQIFSKKLANRTNVLYNVCISYIAFMVSIVGAFFYATGNPAET